MASMFERGGSSDPLTYRPRTAHLTPLDEFPKHDDPARLEANKARMARELDALRMAAFCTTDDTEFMGWLSKHGYLLPIDSDDLLAENEQLYREANKQ